MKYLGGLLLGGLGTMCLTASLQQIIDFAEPAGLFDRAFVAFLAALVMFMCGMLLVGLTFLVSMHSDRLKIAWPVVVMMTAVSGVALSLSISFAIAGGIATLLPKESEWIVTLSGVLLLFAGYWCTREFWREVRSRLAAVLCKPPAATVQPPQAASAEAMGPDASAV